MAGHMAIMQGDLAEYSVPDLLQFMNSSRKQGQLLLEGAGSSSAGVYFEAGQVVHAYCPPRTGVPALYHVLPWREGRFAFLKNAAPVERTIHDELQNLLLDGLRRLDEYRVIAERLPPAETVLHLARAGGASAEVRLTLPEWRILSSVNGRRTLDEIIRAGEGSEDESGRTVYGLLMAGLVTTASDETWLQQVVPARISADEAPAQRGPPPTILANLVLKQVDGRKPLSAILGVLACGERALVDEVTLLVRTGWVRIAAGAEAWQRYLVG